jgi:hypothetical protein
VLGFSLVKYGLAARTAVVTAYDDGFLDHLNGVFDIVRDRTDGTGLVESYQRPATLGHFLGHIVHPDLER